MTEDQARTLAETSPREFNALIECCVMGKPGRFVTEVYINGNLFEAETWLPDGADPKRPPSGWSAGKGPPDYLSKKDMNPTWSIVLKMWNYKDPKVRTFHMVHYSYQRAYVLFGHHDSEDWVEANGEGAFQQAVAIAALKAVGVVTP